MFRSGLMMEQRVVVEVDEEASFGLEEGCELSSVGLFDICIGSSQEAPIGTSFFFHLLRAGWHSCL